MAFELPAVEIICAVPSEVALDLEFFLSRRAHSGLTEFYEELGVAELEEEVVVDSELGLLSVLEEEDFFVAQRSQEAGASVLPAFLQRLFGVPRHLHAVLQLHQHHVVAVPVDQRVELALFELREAVQQLRPFYRAVIHRPELLNQELFRPLLLFRTACENASIEQTP